MWEQRNETYTPRSTTSWALRVLLYPTPISESHPRHHLPPPSQSFDLFLYASVWSISSFPSPSLLELVGGKPQL